jgi:L-ribulose-5-phosphate 3-epimerase
LIQIGIMQGRLSPARARPQSFPWESWQAEFERARSFGFDAIEWLFDPVGYEQNPIWTEVGLTQIRESMLASGVTVRSICADYFVGQSLLGASEAERRRRVQVLNVLVTRASQLGVRVVVVPALEAGEVRDADGEAVLLDCLSEPLALARSGGVTLAVESNMPAERYLELMDRSADCALGICFDTGNRTAQGEDIIGDLDRLAPWVAEVHVKDRLVGGPNVPLGEGAAPFDGFFARLAVGGYSGPLILETTVQDDYEYHAKRNLAFVRSRVSRVHPVDANV